MTSRGGLPPQETEKVASAGFTLVEILVALAIVALTFGFALQAFSGAFNWVDRNRKTAHALVLAQSTLARVGRDIAVIDGVMSGTDNDGYSWRVDTIPYGDTRNVPAGRLIGHRVEVTVAWTEWQRRRQVQLTTLRLAPKGAGS
ncbi:MAG TPA: type II secretion system protein [Stellaceae bacterium]|jgi:general secretion pathway protein I